MSLSKDAKLVELTKSRPQGLEDVVAIVGESPVRRLAGSIPDHLAAAGWEVFGDGDHAWQATSPLGEVIHYLDGKIQAGPWEFTPDTPDSDDTTDTDDTSEPSSK